MNWIPRLPSKEVIAEIEEEASRMTEADIQRIIAENNAWIAEYRRKYPDDWKPDHLR